MSTYSTTVLADSPYIFYRLNDTTTVATDSSSNLLHGTYSSNNEWLQQQVSIVPELDTPNVASSVLFNPGNADKNGTITKVSPAGFPTTAITFELWLSNHTNSSYDQGLISYSPNSYLHLTTSGIPRLVVNGIVVVSGSSSVDDGRIHYIAATWESATGTAQIYIDHELDAVGSGAIGFSFAAGGTLNIGRNTGVDTGFKGKLDNVAIYSTVLSLAQIRARRDAASTNFRSSSFSIFAYPPVIAGDLTRYSLTTQDFGTLPVGSGVLETTPNPVVVISSVGVLSSTQIQVNFSLPVLDSVALRSPSNYVISPTLNVVSVTPEVVTNPTYVVLTTSEMLQGQPYTITIYNALEAA